MIDTKELGKEVWEKMEILQKRSIIPDHIQNAGDYEALLTMESSLDYHQKCVKVLKRLIKQNTVNS